MRAKLADGHNDAGLFRKSRPNPGCSTSSSFRGDRGFESISLQRRVRSEPRPATMSRPQRRHPTLAASMGRVEAERGPTARAEGDPDAGGIATGLVVVGDLDQGDENVRASEPSTRSRRCCGNKGSPRGCTKLRGQAREFASFKCDHAPGDPIGPRSLRTPGNHFQIMCNDKG
jgi:hypothetical protein